MNLLSVLAMIAIIAVLAGFGYQRRDAHAHLIVVAQRELSGIFQQTANQAMSAQIDGATIAVSPLAGNRSTVKIYLGRPDAAAPIRLVGSYPIEVPFTLADGTANFAIIVAKDGSGSVASGWTDWTQINAPAECSSVPVILGATGWTQAITLQCSTLSI